MSNDTRPQWLEDAIEQLPRQMAPSRNLWPQIEVRIDRRGRSRSVAWGVAASVLLSAAAVLFAYQSYRLQAEEANYARLATEAIVAPYRAAHASGALLWSARRVDTAPELASEIDRNLAILRLAQSQLRAGLEHDPEDARLIEMLRFALQRELDLLQQASEVAQRAI